MKKIILFLIILICGLLTGIIVLLNRSLKVKEYDLKVFTEVDRYAVCHIGKGDIVDERIFDGVVTGDEAICTEMFEYKNDYEVLVNTGDVIDESVNVLRIDNRDINLKKTMRFIGVKEELTGDQKYVCMTYLDYSKLYIETFYENDLDEMINVQSDFVIMHGEEKLSGVKLLEKSCVVNDGKINMKLVTDKKLLPGENVSIHMIVKEYKDQWLISSDAVYENEAGTYIVYLDGNNKKPLNVKVVCKNNELCAIQFDETYAERTFVIESNRH